MKLEVGMYIRTKHGIRKITEIDEDNNYYIDKTYTNDFRQEINCISDSCIIGEPSFNIIDLIEVEDYVNGYKVTRVGGTYHGRKDKAIYCDYQQNEKTNKWIMIYDDEIKSIVTKEQFEQMSYKVKESK